MIKALSFYILFFNTVFAFNFSNTHPATSIVHFQAKKRVVVKYKTFKSNAELKVKNFSNSIIEHVVFENIVFKGTKFKNSKLKNVKFLNCKFRNADFRNSNLKSVIFKKSEIEHSYFDFSQIYISQFYFSKFKNSSFKGANIINTLFTKCDLTGNVWINGKRCEKGSIDKCIIKKRKRNIIIKFQ